MEVWEVILAGQVLLVAIPSKIQSVISAVLPIVTLKRKEYILMTLVMVIRLLTTMFTIRRIWVFSFKQVTTIPSLAIQYTAQSRMVFLLTRIVGEHPREPCTTMLSLAINLKLLGLVRQQIIIV